MTLSNKEFNLLFSRAVGYLQTARHIEAKEIFSKLVVSGYVNFEIFYFLGVIEGQENNFIEATNYFLRAIEINPSSSNAIYNLGLMYQKLSNSHAALDCYDKVISLNPSDSEAHNNRGNVLKEEEEWSDALESYLIAISLDKKNFQAYCNAAVTLKELMRNDEAEEFFNKAIEIEPKYPEIYYNRGNLMQCSWRLEHAIKDYQKAIHLNPNHLSAINNLGNALLSLSRFDEAVATYDQLIKKNPNYEQAYNNKGLALQRLGRNFESIDNFNKAISLNAEYAEAYNNLGISLSCLNKIEQAIAAYKKAIELKPDYSEAYNNLGVAHHELRCFNCAIKAYEKAIDLDLNYIEAQYNLSLTLLTIKKFEKGWLYYESRKKRAQFNYPEVDKELNWSFNRSERPLLLWAEQGVGDQILFCTIIPELINYPQEITIAVDRRLIPLLDRSFPTIKFIDSSSFRLSEWHGDSLPLGSLPFHFRSDIDSFKKKKSPLILANESKIASHKAKISGSQRLICGVSWRSSRETIGSYKSMLLSEMISPFFDMPIDFVDLQYGDTISERSALFQSEGVLIKHFEEVDNFHDLDGLASLIQCCDFIITVSNTTAHLAGALNKNTFVLLPFGRGNIWYWEDHDGENLWYPSVKCFRQKTKYNWCDPIYEVRQYLESRIG